MQRLEALCLLNGCIGDGDGLMLVVHPERTRRLGRYAYSNITKRTDHTLGRWPTVTWGSEDLEV